MPDLFALLDACCEAYDNQEFRPRDVTGDDQIETFCNYAVRDISEKMGYDGFAVTMLANEMIDFMAASMAWRKATIAEAQKLANEGRLVIATQKAKPHGHVAVVRPGNAVWSTKWEKFAPKLMNIGSKNSIAKSANWVFPGDAPPDFYVLL